MFLNINFKKIIAWPNILVFGGITLVILGAIFILVFMNGKTRGDKLQNKIDLNFSNYYAEYDMTVISNKNINTYKVKETHKQGVITTLEYLDYMKNVVNITLENNTCYISNSGNTSKLIVNNMYENRNISSLSTFGYVYNLVSEKCNCIKSHYIKDGETVVEIKLSSDKLCTCSNLGVELGISSLKLIFVDKRPKNYIIYGKNKKEYISIVYNIYQKT